MGKGQPCQGRFVPDLCPCGVIWIIVGVFGARLCLWLSSVKVEIGLSVGGAILKSAVRERCGYICPSRDMRN